MGRLGRHTTRIDKKVAAQQVIFHRRLHRCSILAAVLALAGWVTALAIEYWYVVRCPGGYYLPRTGLSGLPEAFLMAARSGIWRTCRILVQNVSAPATASPINVITACRSLDLTALEQLPDDDPVNVDIGYRRTSLAFSVLSVLLLLLAVFFSWYTIKVPRYTFKRVSGCLYFIVAGVELVVINLLTESISLQEESIPAMMPPGCSWSYSTSYIVAWVCFTVHVVCGLSFLLTSGKKKREVDSPVPGLDPIDDEPTIIGR